jgi:hypothetical protein
MRFKNWQGRQDSNPRPAVLETAALPAELHPYVFDINLRPSVRGGLFIIEKILRWFNATKRVLLKQ